MLQHNVLSPQEQQPPLSTPLVNVVRLVRLAHMDFGVYGRLLLPGGQVFTTVERPWRKNNRFESCIPEGEYRCVPRRFNRGGYEAFHVLDVPNRDLILFHRANTPRDVEGCIGVGTGYGYVGGQWAITNSLKGFEQFKRTIGPAGEFRLIITRP